MKFIIPILALFSLSLVSCQSSKNSKADNSEQEKAVEIIAQDIDQEEFKKRMAEDNAIILDVRTPKEIAEGKIDGSINIDILNPEWSNRMDSLDKSKTYLIYCKSGGRSNRAMDRMKDKGFVSLYNLMGGYSSWAD